MEDTLNVGEQYDLDSNIKNVEINTSFIIGLDKVIVRYFLDLIEDKTQIPNIIEKINKINEGTLNPEEAELSDTEIELYTIVTIKKILAYNAEKQGLVKKSNAKIEKALIEDLIKSYSSNDYDKVREINDKITSTIKEQLS